MGVMVILLTRGGQGWFVVGPELVVHSSLSPREKHDFVIHHGLLRMKPPNRKWRHRESRSLLVLQHSISPAARPRRTHFSLVGTSVCVSKCAHQLHKVQPDDQKDGYANQEGVWAEAVVEHGERGNKIVVKTDVGTK